MANPYVDKKYPYLFFTSVNRRVNPYTVKDQELFDSVNWWTEYTLGAKKVRPGYSLFLDRIDNNAVTGFSYVKFPNGFKRLARLSGANIYAVDPTTANTWGAAQLTLGSGNPFSRPDSTVLQGIVHIVTQISAVESHYIEWTDAGGVEAMVDTTYASGGGDVVIPYKPLCNATYHRRVYVGSPYDVSGLYRSQLDWSSVDYQPYGTGGANTPWTTQANNPASANFTPVDQDYKGSIIKLTTTQDRLNIYKENGIYSFNESSLFELFGLSPYQGSVADMDENQTDYFFTNEGFFANNGSQVTPIGEGWYNIIKQILANGIDPTKIVSLAVNFLYFCFMGTITYDGKTLTNAMFVYNAYYDEMYLWSMGHQVTALGFYIDASGNKQVVFGDNNGFTYKFDYAANTDSGVTIEAELKTKYFFFDEPQKRDQISEVYGFATQGSELEISLDPDFAGEYKYPVLAMQDQFNKARFDLSTIGAFNVLSAKVAWNGKGARPEFYGLIFNVKQNSERIRGRRQK